MEKRTNTGNGSNRASRTAPPRERTPLRDHLESLAVAVLLVLIVRQVVVEAFLIRGGSMAPTLISEHREMRCPNCGAPFIVGVRETSREWECPNCHFDWTDTPPDPGLAVRLAAPNETDRGAARVFVNKFIYRLRSPKRWEVAVFQVKPVRCAKCRRSAEMTSDHPPVCPDCGGTVFDAVVSCRQCRWSGPMPKDGVCPECGARNLQHEQGRNFIKRVVGLPGEAIQLTDGDAYADGHLLRKSQAVQDQIWIGVYDSQYVPKRPLQPIWRIDDEAASRCDVKTDGGPLTVTALDSAGPVLVAYAPEVRDFYAYARAAGRGASGANVVGDCRIEARVRPTKARDGGAAVLEVADSGHVFRLSVPVGAAGRALLEKDGEPVTTMPGGLEPQASSWIALENYDDRLVARLNGRILATHEYAPAGAQSAWRRGVRFGARNADVGFERVRISRDIYYVNSDENLDLSEGPYHLADDEYLVLGDDSPLSRDSRSQLWLRPGVSESHMVGRAFFVFWPVQCMEWLSGGVARAAEGPAGE